jgi:serine protease
MRRTPVILSLLAAVLLAPVPVRAPRAEPAVALDAAVPAARVIVKYKADPASARKTVQAASPSEAASALASRARSLGARVGIALAAGHGVAARMQVVTAAGISSEQLAQRLAQDAEVEYAAPDRIRKRFAVPNDPFYASRAATSTTGGPLVGQWYLKPPGAAGTAANTAPSAIDAEAAWDVTTGDPAIVVAVLDTGIRFDHADFRTAAAGGNLLPGYDMIAQDATSADGQPGRDADASDPGDAVTMADVNSNVPGCTVNDIENSSWHGTQTAGLIGAVTDNALGMASVGRNVRVLPVRVLGKCGGYDSDIVAGMRWAAGLDVPGVPANPNPARVINMSLGGSGSCDASNPSAQVYIDTIRTLNALPRPVVVVASAGNTAGHAVSIPADCAGVIGVAGLRHIGTKVGFSDLGPEITISAPGGNCVNLGAGQACQYPILTTSNAGTAAPLSNDAGGSIFTDSFAHASVGTSFSAPLVAGTVALMLSVQPLLTTDEVRYKLQATARPFPQPSTDESGTPLSVCTAPTPTSADQLQCVCSAGLCGAGMLDAGAAVRAAAGVQARITVAPATVLPGQPVTLSAVDSILPAGRTIDAYQWALVDDGGGIVPALGASTGPSITVTPTAPGSFTLSLTVTDNQGVVSAESVTVLVAGGGSGGGGALGGVGLLGLLAALGLLSVAGRGSAGGPGSLSGPRSVGGLGSSTRRGSRRR